MKKGITLITIICYLCFFNFALAVNTYSIDLELSSSQWLSITDADQTGLDLTEDLSFSLWINSESHPNTQQYLITKRDGTQYSFQLIYLEYAADTYRFQMSTYNTTATDNNAYLWDDYGLTLTEWVHLVLTIDTSSQTGLLYVDGSSNSPTSSSGSATAIENSTANFDIGARGNTGSVFWDGKMDEIGIWNRVLTPTEVAEIYNSGDGLTYDNYDAGLLSGNVAYWRLDDSLLDETANNNDLTNNNSATFSVDIPFIGAVVSRRIIQIQ